MNLQYKTGYKYATGDGVSVNKSDAVVLFYHSAQQGHAQAQFMLAYMLDKGEGVKRDHKQ